ncbi:MAG: hypothetical protein ACM3JB_22215 [Acidobacteriaceae bacterium]
MKSTRARVTAAVLGIAIALAAAILMLKVGQLVVALIVFPGIPIALAWFAYHVFLKKLLRLRRIRNARERREMREAALRDREE